MKIFCNALALFSANNEPQMNIMAKEISFKPVQIYISLRYINPSFTVKTHYHKRLSGNCRVIPTQWLLMRMLSKQAWYN